MPPPTEALLPFRLCIRRPRTTDQLLRNSCHSYGLPLAFLGKSPELSVSSPASRDWRYSDSPRSWTIRLRRPDRNLRIVDLFTFEFDFSFKPKLLTHCTSHERFKGAALEHRFDQFLFVGLDRNGAHVLRYDYRFPVPIHNRNRECLFISRLCNSNVNSIKYW